MTFINEKISSEDSKKFSIDEINKDYLRSPGANYYWTIDRERDIYLRWMKSDHQEPTEQQVSFYWKGALFRIDFKVTGHGQRGGKGETNWSWNGMRQPSPNDQAILDSHRAEIITDLKDALRAYKDGGIFSTIADHTANFDF